jgi:uncharacterized membrane protein YfcA
MTPILLVIGLGAGVLAGLFGIGGGIIIVPALILWAKFPAATATGTSLAALPLGVLLGAYEYWRNGHVNIQSSLLVAAGLFVGAWLGARLATQLPPLVLKRLFAVFLVVVAVRLWIR